MQSSTRRTRAYASIWSAAVLNSSTRARHAGKANVGWLFVGRVEALKQCFGKARTALRNQGVTANGLCVPRALELSARSGVAQGSIDALTGLVAVVQRTDGALRLNVHLHCLGLDGVYVRNGQGALEFHELKAPSSAEVADIARRTAQRLARAFRKQGRKSPWDDEGAFADSGEADPFSSEQPGLFASYQAAALGIAASGERAGQPILRVLAGGASSELRSSKTEEQPVVSGKS